MAAKMRSKQESCFEFLAITPNRLKYFNTNYTKVNSKLSDYRCDIQFRVGFAHFRAHRDILSDASDYFSAMFGHDMLERKQSLINIHEIGPKGFQCLLDYVYHGHLTIEEKNVEDILETATFFHVDWMVSVACDYLMHFLTVDNFITIIQLADIYYIDEIYPKLFRFMASNLEALSMQPEFYECVTFEVLRDFLDDDIFMEMSEGFILKVVFDWLDEYPDERQEYTFDLLNKIRYGLLQTEELRNLPSKVLKYPEIREKVELAKSYIRCVNTQCLHDGELFCERGAKNTLITMSACEFSNGTMVLYKDPRSANSCFERINSSGLETELEFTSQARLGNFLYVAGGYEADYVSSDRLFRYDPRYRDWFELAPMIHGRVSFAMCSSQSQLFVIGGVNHIIQNDRDNEFILACAEIYNPTDNCWSRLPNLPQGCYGLAATYYDHAVYISGGITSDPADPVPTNYVYAYVIGSDEWTPLPSMLHCRYTHTMEHVNDKIYSIGGKTSVVIGELADCCSIESFDRSTQQWTQVISVPPDLGPICPDVGVYEKFIAFLAGSVYSRVLYLFDTEKVILEEELNCGPGFSKVAVLPVAFPRH